MIKSLHIENIAVIEKTDIEFSNGFNCLTGETGAGKSIVIDSINAVLGERTSKELIRTGTDKAEVSAVFGELSRDALTLLSENGYEADQNGEVMITRTLHTGSGSGVRINGRPATAGILKEISKGLVNIHGQHDNQSLLLPETHIKYIDKVAENSELKEKYLSEFRNLNSIRKELASLETDEGEKIRKTELLNYQINEIESAEITPGETEKLKEQLKLIENYEKTSQVLRSAYYSLNGGDENDGAVSLVRNAQSDIASVEISSLQKTGQKFSEALALLEDIAFDIRNVINGSELSDLQPEKIRSRLDALRSLVLKYGGSEEKVLEYLSSSKAELEKISLSDERIKELSKLLDDSTERLVDLGEELTKSRVAAALAFEKKVTETLFYLNMPDSEFKVSIGKGKYTRIGCDTVEFLIKTNAGDELKPLHKIASGGELSRIMLSIKSVLADKDDVDTLIFDEIDSGISGRAADKVGVQLKAVSSTRQVICVTHLAQIAAYAGNHLLIDKSVKDGKTYTTVQRLGYDERINEIARIMSGTDITDNLYKTAKEMLDRSL